MCGAEVATSAYKLETLVQSTSQTHKAFYAQEDNTSENNTSILNKFLIFTETLEFRPDQKGTTILPPFSGILQIVWVDDC